MKGSIGRRESKMGMREGYSKIDKNRGHLRTGKVSYYVCVCAGV